MLLYLLEKIVCYIKPKIIAFFSCIRCVMLIAYLPTSGIQNHGYFTEIPWKFPLIKVSNLVCFKKTTLGCKNDVLEYEVKLEKC